MSEAIKEVEAGLLACPFCGGKAAIERRGNSRQSTIYACDDCGCRLETGEGGNFGMRWNTRARSPEGGVRDALNVEEKYLLEHFDAECGIMPGDVQGSFHRIRAALRSSPPPIAGRATIEVAAQLLDRRASGYLARSTVIFNGKLMAEDLLYLANQIRALVTASPSAEPVAWTRDAKFEILQEALSRWFNSLPADSLGKEHWQRLIDILKSTPSASPTTVSDASREALDNSQSLLAMIYQLNTNGSVSERDWENEGLSGLITKQINENRAALSPSDTTSAAGKSGGGE